MITLLPCYSLEDFSIYRTPEESNEIFSAWSALYHPALIELFGMPKWERAGNPTPDRTYRLIIIPPCCESQVPNDWLKTMEKSDAVIVRHLADRAAILAEALARLDRTEHGFSNDAVESFLSLGFSHFTSELLSRKLRYMSNLDTTNFEQKTLDAVKALRDGNTEGYDENIRRSFELLAEAKQYFFPTAMKLLDLTRLSADSFGAPLAEMLQHRRTRDEKTNLILPTCYLDRMTREFPETLALLREELAAKRVALVGGDLDESPLYLLPQVEIVERLLLGLLFYKEKLGLRPIAFGRNAAGYSPVLPQLLRLTGFESALLFSGDGWRPNKENQSRIHWQGHDRSRIPTLARNPADGQSDKCYMELADRIGYGANADYVMTSVFEHQPGKERPWLGDMFRSNRYAQVLGETCGLAEFFRTTEQSGLKKRFEKDDFRTNFLTRAGKEGRPNPVSGWRDFYLLRTETAALSSAALFAALHSSKREIERLDGFERLSELARPFEEFRTALEELLFTPVAPALDTEEESTQKEARERADETFNKLGGRLAALMDQTGGPRRAEINRAAAELLYRQLAPAQTAKKKEPGDALPTGAFFVNTAPRPKRIYLTERPGEIAPEVEPLLRPSSVPGAPTLVTLPAYSAVWLPTEKNEPSENVEPKSAAAESPKKRGLFARIFKKDANRSPDDEADGKMIEYQDDRLSDGTRERFYFVRNRFFELKLDATTGGLRALRTFSAPTLQANRGILRQPAMGNRLSVQLALRLSASQRREDGRDPESAAFGYSIMAADSVKILSDDGQSARIQFDGSLIAPDGAKAASFSETLTVFQRSRVITFDISFQPILLPSDGPWENYYGVRFAWNDQLAEVRPGFHGTYWETNRDYLQAPESVDLRSEPGVGLTILSGGLPFYRRYGLRRMDSVLIPKSESARRFRFGIGVDLSDPLGEAETFLAPEPTMLADWPKPKKPLVRFLDVEPASAAVALLESFFETPAGASGENSARKSAPLDGFRLALQETSGKKSVCRVRSRIPILSVVKSDFLRRSGGEIELDDAQSFSVELAAHEILPLDVRLKF